MKILVMSDTHGMIDLDKEILEKIDQMDLLIHLGDHYKDALYLGKLKNIKVRAVKGNCDRENVEEEIILELGKHKIFLTHGHQYGVKLNLTRLYYKALELGCNVALFGHTHMPVNMKYDDILIMNPGSLSKPRGGAKASYGIIEIEEENIKSEIIEI
ncbi:metallophosphoesterase [Crassaminicella thermophila]|uniref:Phosphoesterase n=1 Tax=Crassaminicella thermophila TaxID=2599308 RepID=A0A5C0SHQ1_CRATE|nr:metallophosphoesterase [Crassaminicella thermophila]QEK12954.1 metallophosphoesterase [Crassaminicella thermophila]